MLRLARGSSAPQHGVRFLWLLVSWISIAIGLTAPTCANAASSEWLTVELLQVASDSLGRVGPVGPAATPRQTSTMPVPAPATPKPRANSLQLYGGLFSPIDVNAPSPTLGLRLGRRLGSHLQGGLLVDWTLQRKSLEQPVNALPGLQPHLILAQADGQLVPAMAFLEVSLTEKRYLAPYAGIAAGYEWLLLQATDYRTGETASATFANWAWQGWGGIGLRLDQGMRLDLELNYNGGSLEREVTDSNGQTWREAVRVNGVGARVGVDILY